jgi:diacylglycerol kinase family enzyme
VKRVFLINRKSGSGISRRAIERLEEYFRARDGSFTAFLPESREGAIVETRAALARGAQQIVAVGGDGTASAALNAFFDQDKLINPEACLAVAQAGSGSDYFRGLTHGTRPDWREIVLEPAIRRVDIGRVEPLRKGSIEPLYFLNMATFGFAAEVVRRKSAMSLWWPTAARYLLPTLSGLLNVRPAQLRMRTNGCELARPCFCLIVAKGAYSGGGMKFGREVGLDDGRFELTLFEPMPAWRMILKTPKLYSGNLHTEPNVEKLFSNVVEIDAEPPFLFECDGDVIATEAVKLQVVPQALRVCFPARPKTAVQSSR